jgi:hypothetical protein
MKILLPKFLGKFHGDSWTEKEYDAATLANFSDSAREKESDYFQTKWFDYRRLHPLQATFYWLWCYQDAYQDYIHKYVDMESYEKGIRSDFLNSKEKNAIWRARRYCDRNGIPYDVFIRTRFQQKEDEWRAKNFFPRPKDMLPSLGLTVEEESACCNWEEPLIIRWAVDPIYQINAWRGLECQLAYEYYLVEKMQQRRCKAFLGHVLHTAIYVRKQLRIETAILNFGIDPVREAQSFLEDN